MFRAVVVIGVASIVAAACGADDGAAEAASARARQARELAKDADLPPDVAEFLALAARAPAATFTVEYGLDGGRALLVQRPPHRRVEITTGDRTQAAIVNDDGSFSCLQDRDRWRCEKTAVSSAPTPFSVGDVRRTADELKKAKAAYDFAVEDRRVAEIDARCLVTVLRPGQPADPARGERGALCVSDAGVPLLAEGGRNQFHATRYRTSVADDAFDLPARPR